MDFIYRLRQKPKEVRAQIALLAAASVTGVIFVMWGVTIPDRLALDERAPAPEESAPAPAGVSTNAGTFMGQLRRGAAALIFNAETSTPEAASAPNRTIDISALLQNPPAPQDSYEEPDEAFVEPEPAPQPTAADAAPTAAPDTTTTGEIILIGTSSRSRTE
jgi:hypothetical protein